MKKSSRRWILASVVAALTLGTLITQLDNQKLYGALQTQLAQADIQLQAKNTTLSPMYMGSIHLADVEIKTHAFSLHADHLFIDLNLAALLTGKALPQALYVQAADINVQDTYKETWLKLIENKGFQFKRIDISQSEIHFEQQHITLEQVNLDIRDIGNNKNPRAELRAHIGDGRLDAHGYLHLKRGEVTRGFGRIKLHDIPLTFIQHNTSLEMLQGSITTHIYQNKPWQTFGHLTLQTQHRDKLELRGKIIGSSKHLFLIQDMILDVTHAGSIQISGACDELDTCNINSKSEKIKITTLLAFFKTSETQTLSEKNTLKNININSTWKNHRLTSSGYFSWDFLEFNLAKKEPKKAETIHIEAGKVIFSQLEKNQSTWHLKHATFTPKKNHLLSLSVKDAKYQADHWMLPIQLHDSQLWLPISKTILNQQETPFPVHGQGNMSGYFTVQKTSDDITLSFDLDAKQTQIDWHTFHKPKDINFTFKGSLSWRQQSPPNQVNISINLLDSYTSIHYKQPSLALQSMHIDFDHLNSEGIKLPKPLQAWHGQATGSIYLANEDFNISYIDLDMIDFGAQQHHLSGEVQLVHGQWKTRHLSWIFNKNNVSFSTNKHGELNISAENMDTKGLAFMLEIPNNPHGKLTIKSLSLPFGTLKDVSTNYQSKENIINFKLFKSTFYEGSLQAPNLSISNQNNQFNFTGKLQAGGIRLNNWNWLHKQFDTHLEGTVYATLHLNTNFDISSKLSSWKGDGDIIVYNGTWLLNNKNIKADKLTMKIRKRELFSADFKIKDGKDKGHGNVVVDAKLNTSGQFLWQSEKTQFSKTWPHIRVQ